MLRWANRIADRPAGKPVEETPTPQAPDELMALLDRVDRELQEVVSRVAREGRFDELMGVEFTSERSSRGTAFAHVITHGAHHRAQALNMLRRLGATDLPRSKPSRGSCARVQGARRLPVLWLVRLPGHRMKMCGPRRHRPNRWVRGHIHGEAVPHGLQWRAESERLRASAM